MMGTDRVQVGAENNGDNWGWREVPVLLQLPVTHPVTQPREARLLQVL